MELKKFFYSLGNEETEEKILSSIVASLSTSILLSILLYFLFLGDVSGFKEKYLYSIFMLCLSYSFIISSVRYTSLFQKYDCSCGMMVGMTVGMIAGFLPGFYLGMTNGMFTGGVYGMIIGIILGAYIGNKCCGIMGVMEGIMAGFMGGLMGAMTSVMTLADNLKTMGIIVFVISAVILFGLEYMVFVEKKKSISQQIASYKFEIILSLVLILLSILIMLFGPKSLLFQ